MKLLLEYQYRFPPTRPDLEKLVKWKHPLVLHNTGSKLLVTTKTGKRIPLQDLITVDQFFDDFEEDERDEIKCDLALNTNDFPVCNAIFLLDSHSEFYYARYFVLLRFMQVFDAIATSLDFIKMKAANSPSIDLERIRKFLLPEGSIDTILNVVVFLHPFIQILEYVTDPNTQQNNSVMLIHQLMSYLKKESFSVLSQEELQRIVLSREEYYTPISTTILSIVNAIHNRSETKSMISPALNEEFDQARYEAYGLLHGNFDNYENPQTESEMEHRKQANQVREELISFNNHYVDCMGVDVDLYLEHSQFRLLNSIVKRVKRRASNHVERSFFSFDFREVALCARCHQPSDEMLLAVKGTLSCIVQDPKICKRYINYFQQFSKLKERNAEDGPFFIE